AEVVPLASFPPLGVPEEIAEEIAENVIKVSAEAEIIEGARSILRAEAIEMGPLFRVAEHLVGEVYLLEFLFCFLITAIAVRVVCEGELPVGLLYFLIGGVPRNAEYFIEILPHTRAISYSDSAVLATDTMDGLRSLPSIRYPFWSSAMTVPGSTWSLSSW